MLRCPAFACSIACSRPACAAARCPQRMRDPSQDVLPACELSKLTSHACIDSLQYLSSERVQNSRAAISPRSPVSAPRLQLPRVFHRAARCARHFDAFTLVQSPFPPPSRPVHLCSKERKGRTPGTRQFVTRRLSSRRPARQRLSFRSHPPSLQSSRSSSARLRRVARSRTTSSTTRTRTSPYSSPSLPTLAHLACRPTTRTAAVTRLASSRRVGTTRRSSTLFARPYRPK